jgi:hypothetical protein
MMQIKSTFYYLSEDDNIYELSAMESAQEEEQSHPWVPKVAGPGSRNSLQLSVIEWRLDVYKDLRAVNAQCCSFSLLFGPSPSTELPNV